MAGRGVLIGSGTPLFDGPSAVTGFRPPARRELASGVSIVTYARLSRRTATAAYGAGEYCSIDQPADQFATSEAPQMLDGPVGPAPDARWRLAGYTHLRDLGSGAVGRVVLARDEATGAQVAVKYLTGAARADGGDGADWGDGGVGGDGERLRAEAELLGSLTSPHIVRLLRYVEDPRGAAIVMEFVDGVSLRDLLRTQGPTAPESALAVLKGSLLGLAAAHEVGVVHRDYKPGNVLVASDGESKLVDFGIAVRSGETGGLNGTPAYMAPEQWAGRPASPATDVYAATATFFECLTGTEPYERLTAIELAVAHTEAEIPDDRVPEPLRPLIRAGLAKRPEDRPAEALALVAELESVARAAYGEEWESEGRRKLAALALLFLAAVGTAGVTAVASTPPMTVETGRAAGSAGSDGAPRGGRRAGRSPGRTAAGVAGGLALVGLVVAALTTQGGPAQGAADGPSPVTAALGTGAARPSDAASPGGTSLPTNPPTRPSSGVSGGAAQPSTSSSTVPTSPATGAPVPGASTSAGPPAASPSASAPASATASATSPSGLRVLAVSLAGAACDGPRAASVSGTVTTDGTSSGTLTVTWTDTAGRTVAVRSTPLPAGELLVPFRFSGQPFGSATSLTARITTDPPPVLGVGIAPATITAASCALQ